MRDQGRDMPPSLALDARTGLPDALRVLVHAHPREGWAAHPHFAGLVAFWLERHMMFRRLLTHLRQEGEARLDGRLAPERHAAGLSRYGGLLVQELHGHHHIEDAHYFPVLAQKDRTIGRGFDLLDADHHTLEADLAGFADAANAALRAPGAEARDAAGACHVALTRLERLLDRHLADEEDLIVPVILKHGTAGLI